MLSEEQRTKRFDYWCSSDTARSLTGLYGGLAACVASKIYRNDSYEPSDLMELGNVVEGPLLDWWEAAHGEELSRDGELTRPEDRMMAHTDGVWELADVRAIVEAKGVWHKAWEWGEAGTDQVNEYTMLQVHHHMVVADSRLAYVVAWFVDRGRQEFIVERDDDLCEGIVEYAKDVWARYVEPGVLPDYDQEDAPHVLEALARRKRETGLVVPVDVRVVKHYETANAAARWAKGVAEECKARLIESLGGGDTAELPDGRVLSYHMQKRAAHSVKASEFPVLRILKGKSDGKRLGGKQAPALTGD